MGRRKRIESIITDKICCGCEACRQACPKECIHFSLDNQGFFYPIIDYKKCIDCEACERVCPVLNSVATDIPIQQFAAYSIKKDIRMHSSSGGIFPLLSEFIILKRGVVFGASFDKNWNVSHSFCESVEEIQKFQGSKYVQSRIGNSYKNVKKFLLDDRYVLFTGTPCQISGLKLFLRKDYNKLYTVEVGCHGVPSPVVWQKYIERIEKKGSITAFNFRDKTINGWEKYSYCISRPDGTRQFIFGDDNFYSNAFLGNLILRPSCFNCRNKLDYSKADITICDYWGVKKFHPDMDDNLGCSAVIIHTQRGKSLFDSITCIKTNTALDSIVSRNPSLIISSDRPSSYYKFWKLFKKKGIDAIEMSCTSKKSFLPYVGGKFRRVCSLLYHTLFKVN